MRISIEGSIGTGKTSALCALRDAFPEIPVHIEPIDEWTELLNLYYSDKSLWCLPFSLKVLMSFRRAIPGIAFIERSPLSCKNVFTHMLVSDGIMNQRQYEVFTEYHDLIGWTPDAIIYIDTPAATCLERVEHRGRTCEKEIDLQFLRRLEYAYETMLKHDTHGIRVIRIDGTKSKEEVARDIIQAARVLVEKNVHVS
jgi:deoxyadenosine/deoxycytidine kinase